MCPGRSCLAYRPAKVCHECGRLANGKLVVVLLSILEPPQICTIVSPLSQTRVGKCSAATTCSRAWSPSDNSPTTCRASTPNVPRRIRFQTLGYLSTKKSNALAVSVAPLRVRHGWEPAKLVFLVAFVPMFPCNTTMNGL